MKGDRRVELAARGGDETAMAMSPRWARVRRGGHTHSRALALAGLVLVAGCSPAASASPGSQTSSTVPGSGLAGSEACAWPELFNLSTANSLLLDAAEQVWTDSFPISPGLQIVLSGTFPDARYASLQVYTQPYASPFTRNGVASAPLTRAA
jgi:hypothetical protein